VTAKASVRGYEEGSRLADRNRNLLGEAAKVGFHALAASLPHRRERVPQLSGTNMWHVLWSTSSRLPTWQFAAIYPIAKGQQAIRLRTCRPHVASPLVHSVPGS